MATFVSNIIPPPGYALYRAHASTIDAPFLVRSTGRYRFDAGWRDGCWQERKPILELFWCTSGQVCFHPDEPPSSGWLLQKGEACFLLPGDRHDVGSATDGTEWWWMTLDGVWLPHIIDSLSITRAPQPCGNCPVELFQRLAREMRGVGRQAEVAASQTAYQLLMAARFPSLSGGSHLARSFQELVASRYQESGLTLEEIARELGASRATLIRIVTRECGMPPHEYLTSVRMQHAMRLLQEGRSVKETATATGFAYQNYFSRLFFQNYGRHPSSVLR